MTRYSLRLFIHHNNCVLLKIQLNNRVLYPIVAALTMEKAFPLGFLQHTQLLMVDK